MRAVFLPAGVNFVLSNPLLGSINATKQRKHAHKLSTLGFPPPLPQGGKKLDRSVKKILNTSPPKSPEFYSRVLLGHINPRVMFFGRSKVAFGSLLASPKGVVLGAQRSICV
jgi:Na+-transporting methylmalonyl-CoA/oxaloacetate decarboxylase beta subunit